MRIGVDAGGTFTDFVVLHEDGRIESFKLRSNPRAPARVILEGLARATGGAAADVVHGSTVATNALIERKGAKTAFVTTAGFEDILQIGRQNRGELYNLTPVLPRPLVPSALSFGVKERTYFDGSVALRPSQQSLKKLAGRLRRAGVKSIAVCLLHSCQNPQNEKSVRKGLITDAYLCCSHEVCPEFREYERASTTALNAYVGPMMGAYLAELEREWRDPVWILQSNGGFMTAAEARRHAVRTMLSGPAGGVAGALGIARLSGFDRVLGFDMGGTSTDVSLCDGKPRETTEGYVEGFPIRVPMLDLHTVGAGGGSIARVDAGGLLRVGPESAGADPGPACYGVADQPTVTDAHVVLGRIAARQFLGGEMPIDVRRSAAAVDRIAAALKLSRTHAAEGILRVANANMARAIRVVSVERGHDPRDFTLVAFGGCGGLHACELAEELGIRRVLVPEHAGALSALGMLMADRVRDYAAGVLNRSDIEPRFLRLERQARRDMPGAKLLRLADVRYRGQSYEITVPWTPRNPALPFHREHERLYGYARPAYPVEIVTARVRALIQVAKPRLRRSKAIPAGTPDARRICVGGRWTRVPVWRRERLGPSPGTGPALVLDYGATSLIPPGWSFLVDASGNLVIRH